ncbi:UNVERIFIED_CONTAM: hypothetical protein HDU68_006775 [Siphonaria sp. JEL0065]|nr:hypothetical protein HDU68_006775 [Siphonaria sp. JEL0065]
MKSILASNTSTFYIFESLDDKFEYESCGFVYARAFYVRSDGKETKSRPPLLKPDGTPPTAGELKGQFGFVTAKLMKGCNFANFAALEKSLHERVWSLGFGRHLHRKKGGAQLRDQSHHMLEFAVGVTYRLEGYGDLKLVE